MNSIKFDADDNPWNINMLLREEENADVNEDEFEDENHPNEHTDPNKERTPDFNEDIFIKRQYGIGAELF